MRLLTIICLLAAGTTVQAQETETYTKYYCGEARRTFVGKIRDTVVADDVVPILVRKTVNTKTGRVITSVCFDPPNAGAALCHEVGAYCEANRLQEAVVASVCVSRSAPDRSASSGDSR